MEYPPEFWIMAKVFGLGIGAYIGAWLARREEARTAASDQRGKQSGAGWLRKWLPGAR